jgi:hypothetical protein
MEKYCYKSIFKNIVFVILLSCLALGGLLLSHSVTYADSPVAKINKPTDGTSYAVGTAITFDGAGTDTVDEEITDLQWTSDIDGYIGEGKSFTYSDLTVGKHIITLTVTNSNGDTGEKTVSITINPPPPPVAKITKPTNPSSYAVGTTITFEGTGTDSIEGGLTDLQWTSDIDGYIGEGKSFTYSDLTVGEHIITLTVTNSNGDTGNNTVTVTINPPPPPVAKITKPTDGTSYAVGTPINFEGSGTDTIDVEVTDLQWTSDIDGYIGEGKSFTYSDLTVGEHIITLTVTNSNGDTGEKTVKIKVTSRVNIDSPTDWKFPCCWHVNHF